ncbi:class F sortase [Streptomyces sp. CA-294286]|uniref:class F sortase n=1 Tax=Streptomyces sp. CA-294286 TaxID=3240070 RepID=UPI003D8D545D
MSATIEPSTQRPRRPGLATSLIAALTLLGGGLVACGGSGTSAAPDVHVENATTAPASPGPSSPGQGQGRTQGQKQGQDQPGNRAPLKASRPTGLSVPSAGVHASAMLELGLDGNRELEVPAVPDAGKPGWYTGSVTPGETGASILVAHYDTARGPALLRNVAEVEVGDPITVDRADGSTVRFRIREIQQVDKKDFPTNKVYGKTDRPELRLITCGGPIKNGHRSDNIIFFADLVQ